MAAWFLAAALAVALAIGGCLPRHSPIAVDEATPWLAVDRQGHYWVLQSGEWVRCYNIMAFFGNEPNVPPAGG